MRICWAKLVVRAYAPRRRAIVLTLAGLSALVVLGAVFEFGSI